MTEKEMNSYRFSPYQEPTDEMLEQIMKEVAEEANHERSSRRSPGEQPEGYGRTLGADAAEYLGQASQVE